MALKSDKSKCHPVFRVFVFQMVAEPHGFWDHALYMWPPVTGPEGRTGIISASTGLEKWDRAHPERICFQTPCSQ